MHTVDEHRSSDTAPPRERAPRADSRLLASVVLFVANLAVLVPVWPGLISYDANSTIFEAESGPVRDWWSPFLSVLWRALLSVGDIWLVFMVQTVMVVAGTYLCLRLVLRRVPAAAAALLICVFPPLYAQLVGPSRDGYFLGFTLLAFGCLCAAVRGGRRATWASLGVAAAIASSLARQNGIAVVFAIGAVCAVLACRDPEWRPRRLQRSGRRLPAVVGVACAAAL